VSYLNDELNLRNELVDGCDLKLTDTAVDVLTTRYLARDEGGNVVETPAELFYRVARHVASAELTYDNAVAVDRWTREFFQVMTDLEFLPNTPTLVNAGRPLGQLAGCFVLPVGDSIEEIFDAIKHTALIHKSGGGTGFSFSRLRGRDSVVASTGGVASGPVSFMRIFDAATAEVRQGGVRRGANLGLLRVDHPDVLQFIDAKVVDGNLANFNLSVGITDIFMRAVAEGWSYPLVDPRTGHVVGDLFAPSVLDLIVRRAHANGEPGVVFLDAVNRANPTPELGPIEAVNPCGEQPLLPYEACNLGSINLSRVGIIDGEYVDLTDLRRVVGVAVRFLDDVVDVNRYPLPEIRANCLANRKIGLGVMGWADLLYRLRIPYNSERAIQLATVVMRFISEEAVVVSRQLAVERGPFTNFNRSIFKDGVPRRNATLTTIAPTGTLSMIAGCSGGIEPVFALEYDKNVLGKSFHHVHPEYAKVVDAFDGDLPDEVRGVFVTAADVAPSWHVRMQAAFQEFVDNAVSKTINLPATATVEDVRGAILLAYELNCKGITVYRDGSRAGQVLTTNEADPPVDGVGVQDRPATIAGRTVKYKTGCGSIYVTINDHDDRPFEVFVTRGKSGGCAAANTEAIARLISLALRSGVDREIITQQLQGIRCSTPTWHHGRLVHSCPDAVAHVLSSRGDVTGDAPPIQGGGEVLNVDCPDCGHYLVRESGCDKCMSCGYSRCG
jgi:ribonucleoside-diphosphate reductase alpha chain